MVLLLAGVVGLSACEGEGGGKGPGGRGEKGLEAPSAGPERRVLVASAVVENASVADYLVTSGTLESEAQADIVPEASGVVTRLYVEEGDTVTKGQVLAIMANPSLDANAERTKLELDKARLAAEEARKLHTKGAISDTELRDTETAWRSAQTTFQEASRSRGFARIESPIAGTVAVRDVRLGEVAGGARAFQVVDLSRLRVVVQLPEKDLPRVRVGQTALLSGAYNEDRTAKGTVQRVSPVVDAATGTLKVTIAVEPGQDALRPGQFVKVRVEVDRHKDVLTVPRRALVWDDGEPVAWKVIEAKPPEKPEGEDKDKEAEGDEGPGFLASLFGGDTDGDGEDKEEEKDPWVGVPRRGGEKARLEIGFTDTERVEITKGLVLGDRVVTAGNANLRAETLIKLEGDADPVKEEPKDGEKGDKDGKADAADAEGEE